MNANSNYQDTVLVVGDFGNYDPNNLNNHSGLFYGDDADFAPTPDSLKLMYADLYCEEDDEFYIGNVGGADGGDRTGNNFTDEFIRGYYMGGDEPDPLNPELNEYGFYDNTFIDKLLRTKWHQDAPFNNRIHYIPDSPERRPAGCTTIAAAQILARIKNIPPTNISSDVLSTWDSLEQVVDEYDMPVADSLAIIIKAMADGIGVKYNYLGSGGTFATPSMVKRYLERIGCSVSKYNSLSDNVRSKIISSLRSQKPVFFVSLDGLYGHAWVFDGYGANHSGSFLHCNFGWKNGNSNGWYIYKCFKSSSNDRILDSYGTFDFNYDAWYRVLIIN